MGASTTNTVIVVGLLAAVAGGIALAALTIGGELAPTSGLDDQPVSAIDGAPAGASGSTHVPGHDVDVMADAPAPTAPRSREERAARRAETLRELASERVERLTSATFEPADLDVSATGRRLVDVSVPGAEVELLGTRCEPRPCVFGIRVTGSAEARQQALGAVHLRALEEGEESDAQPSMQRTESGDADEAFVFFVPNHIGSDGSELLAARAAGHVEQLGTQ